MERDGGKYELVNGVPQSAFTAQCLEPGLASSKV